MDYQAIIASIGSFILGIGVVSALLAKVLPKAEKYLGIATHALAIADDLIVAIKDGKVEQIEIDKIMGDVALLKDDLKK